MNICTEVKIIRYVIKLWRMRHLTLEGKINTFKFIAISKIAYLHCIKNEVFH